MNAETKKRVDYVALGHFLPIRVGQRLFGHRDKDIFFLSHVLPVKLGVHGNGLGKILQRRMSFGLVMRESLL
ncbi:MAG: hypothetical protein A2W18_08365 [Candidatus Muproteobacteria bacterium RBG_16_60_9]|uniref:Uncharacterized protein n=1 Tax=Candidatus Muproteobacteria bacterium RBG_16_60_9 TaxID=1817755 RepID=A0A1F6UWH2_9PROT|nr:MAG: hypothetical protein A2W18_08365 [Candidatus Muproteobacteria bacterium RBG_16_60_9]